MLRIGNIIILRVRTLFTSTTDNLQIEKISGINKLAGIDIISITTIGNSYFVLKVVDNCVKYDNLTDKLKALERL